MTQHRLTAGVGETFQGCADIGVGVLLQYLHNLVEVGYDYISDYLQAGLKFLFDTLISFLLICSCAQPAPETVAVFASWAGGRERAL